MAKYTYVTYEVKDDSGQVVDILHQVSPKTMYINIFESNSTDRVYIDVSGRNYPKGFTVSEKAFNVVVEQLRKKMNVVPDKIKE